MDVRDPSALLPHPAALLFPLLEGDALDELTNDIKANGLRSPIVLLEGAVLDGRNRLAACLAGGVVPRFVSWSKKGSPTLWVLSMNLHRRHLDGAQRAMIAARAKEQFRDETQRRQKELAGTRKNKARDLTADRREGRGTTATDKAAALLNVSPRLVDRAAKVLRDGHEDLIAAVHSGDIALTPAAELARLPKEEQSRAVRARTEPTVTVSPPLDRYEMARRLKSKRREPSKDTAELFQVLYTLRSVRNAWGFLVGKWDEEQRVDMLPATRASREKNLNARLHELTRDFEELAEAYPKPDTE